MHSKQNELVMGTVSAQPHRVRLVWAIRGYVPERDQWQGTI
jgi:hypothetical protein